MEGIITRFVAALRRAGVRVSPSETLDAVAVLSLGGVGERAAVRSMLRLTLVKRAADLAVFDREFERFFQLPGADGGMEDIHELVQAALITLENPGLRRELLEKGEESGLTLLVEGDSLPDNLENLNELETIELEDTGAPKFVVQSRGNRRTARANVPLVASMEQGRVFGQPPDSWRNEGFVPFTDEERESMLEVVARMLQRLRKDARRLKDRQRRGRLHVIRTIQKNYRCGMVPFLLALRRKRKEKPRLVVLCDVSYSVSHAARFMLLLLHTLQNRLMDVRSFVYNRDLGEVTDILRDMPLNSLLGTIESGDVVDLDASTDFGRVLLDFRRRFLESLRGRPAVVILGDARNNYNEANEWVLDEIRERAAYMLWLTPEESSSWDLGDCRIRTYGRFCNKVEVVRNVEELSAVVEALVRDVYAHGGSDHPLYREIESPTKTGSATKAWRRRLGLKTEGFS